MNWCLQEGDCVKLMQALPAECVHSIVADPPYGLEFMGKEFDRLGHGRAQQEWHHRWAVEAFRIALPGAHIVAFGGTRTYHRLASALEDAGWEIRDSIHWTYGSGFPKSLNLSRAIDKHLGAEREVVGSVKLWGNAAVPCKEKGGTYSVGAGKTAPAITIPVTIPATDEAKKFSGHGTALKPAHEPICVARKPISERSIAANVIKHSTGGLNIDGCRIEGACNDDMHKKNPHTKGGFGHGEATVYGKSRGADTYDPTKGRWPANVMLTHSADCRPVECAEGCPVASLDEQTGTLTSGKPAGTRHGTAKRGAADYSTNNATEDMPVTGFGDSGGASRFFATIGWEPEFDTHTLYHPKATGKERKGLAQGTHDNSHPTVKPVALMQQLVRLVTPPDGVVLDPFTGSGSTGVAAIREGFKFLGMEQDPEYAEIARRRLVGDFPLVSREVPIDSIIAGK